MDVYREAMESENFLNVTSLDLGEQWVRILQNDLKMFDSTREDMEVLTLHDHMCDISAKKVGIQDKNSIACCDNVKN